MHFNPLLILTSAATAMATLQNVVPVEDGEVPDTPVSAKMRTRDLVTVTLCQSTYLGGPCRDFDVTSQRECRGIVGNEFDDQIYSVKVPEGYRCRFWTSGECNGDSTKDIFSPGADTMPSNVHGKISSFKCYVN